MEWLDPWWSTSQMEEHFRESFRKQLESEVPPGHVLYKTPVKLIARGNGDDALFEILDGTGRVAGVHLTWSRRQQRLPWPVATIYANLEEWMEKVMLPEHREWLDDENR